MYRPGALALPPLLALSACQPPTDADPCDTASGSCDSGALVATGDTGRDDSGPPAGDSGDSGVPALPDTCDDLGIDVIMVDPNSRTPAGAFVLTGRFATDAGRLDSTCAPGTTGPEQVVVFTPPESGTWLVSTDGPGSTSDTLLSVREVCDDVTELTCDEGGAGLHGSRVYLEDAVAGVPVHLVVDSVDGDPRGWQLTLRQVQGVAAEGEACGPDTPCDPGLTCVDGDTATCVAFDDPTVTTGEASWVSRYDARVTVAGSDGDHDVAGLWATQVIAEDGTVYGDEPGEPPVPLATTITYDGDGFTAWADVYVAGFQWLLSPVAQMDLAVQDVRGERSGTVRVTIPTKPEQTTAALGESCSGTGFPVTCDSGLTCVDGGTDHVCAEPQPPTLDTVTVTTGAEQGDLIIRATGTDPDADATKFKVLIHFDDDTTRSYSSVYWSTPTPTWNGTSYEAIRELGYYPPDKTAVSVDVTVVDKKNLASATRNVAVTPLVQTVLAEGEGCAPGDPIVVCDEGLSCDPSLLGGHECRPEVAPEVYSADFRIHPVHGWWEVQIEGADLNGDLNAVNIMFTTPDGRYLWGDFATHLSPSVADTTFFRSSIWLEDVPVERFTAAYITLRDKAFLDSNTLVVPLVGTLDQGDACMVGDPQFVCDLGAGLTCGTGGTCVANSAPVIATAVAHRLNSSDVRVDLTGSDLDADAFDAFVVQHADGETEALFPPFLGLDTPVHGQTSFSTSLTLKGIARNVDDLALDIALRDHPGLVGAAVRVDVPAIVGADGTCSGDDTIDRCEDGTSCDAGTCQAHAPVIDAVATTFDDHGRTLVVTASGTDADRDLSNALVVVSGGAGEAKVANITIGAAWGQAHDVTWDGDAFTFTVPFTGWGGPAVADHDQVSVTLVDGGGRSSDEVVGAVRPTRQLGEACDTTGATDRCQAGLTCHEGACATDTADACAGMPLADAATVGTAAGDDITIPYDVTQGSTVALPTCYYNWTDAEGAENAFSWTPPTTGRVKVQLVPRGGDQLGVWVHSGQCVDPGNALACTQYDDEVEVDVVAGQPLYLLVDGFAVFDGTGVLNVTYVVE